MEEMHWSRYRERGGTSRPSPGAPLHITTCSPTWKLPRPGLGFLEASLHRHDFMTSLAVGD